MSLTPFTGTVSLATLRANFDDARAQLLTNSTAGSKDQPHYIFRQTLLAGLALSLRQVVWTQFDFAEVRDFFLRVADTTASRVVTATLTEVGGGTTFLNDNTIALSVTTVNGTVDSRPTNADYRTTTGTRFRLVRGIRYALTIENTTAATTTGVVMAGLQLRSLRRTA